EGGTGTYQLSGGTLNATTVRVNANGTLIFTGGTLLGTVHTTQGTFRVPSTFSTQTAATLNFDATANTAGPTARGIIDGTLVSNGPIPLDDTLISGAGSLNLATGATLAGSGTGRVSR